MSRARRIAIAVAVLAVLQGAAVLLYRAVETTRNEPHEAARGTVQTLPADTRAPPLEARRLDGSVARLSDLRGHLVVVHFWATWCPPCRTELPGLLAFGEQLRSRGEGELLAVSTDEEWAPVRAFLGGAVPRSVVLGPGTAGIFDVDQLPATFVVAPDGTLQARIDGARDWPSRELEGLVPRAGNR